MLIAALAGGVGVGVARAHEQDGMRRAWRLFFSLVAGGTVASMIDHRMPGGTGYVLSKLPTASACALLSPIFIAERMVGALVSPWAMAMALASGPVGGLMCLLAERVTGQLDHRLLWLLEHLPLILVPLGVWSLRSCGLGVTDWLIALLLFALSKFIDALDLPLWQLTAGGVSGHAMHQAPLAASLAWLAWRVVRQVRRARVKLPAPRVEADASGAINRRSTSLTTSG